MTAPQASERMRVFLEAWARAFRTVLAQTGIASLAVDVLDADASEKALAAFEPKLAHAQFAGGGRLGGTLWLTTSEPGAAQVAQLLLGPSEQKIEWDEAHADAYGELLRQAAGIVATDWKSEAGGDVELNYSGTSAPTSVNTGGTCGLRVSAEKLSPILLVFRFDELMAGGLLPAPADQPESEKIPATGNTNLDLLLDMPLEATIRFGERQLLLRDVLALTPGAVVELNRQIHEPAELLVAGRVIGCGEVVVVDGNFGLRITELSTPKQRADLLRTR